jgi:DNA (cytosine-5)-methyltransferase 1
MTEGLIIDCFAGGGGASEGIRQAMGREVDIAVNHDLKALMIHKMNHPSCTHVVEDIFKVKLQEYTRGRHVSLMWASPDCTHFSRARGGKPRSQHIRMLPWAVRQHAEAVRPDVIVMENVAEIQTWEDYGAFVCSMRDLGYSFESRELCAADFGAPTIRKRWYAVLRRDGCRTAWPEQTHARPGTLEASVMPTWVPAARHIDFSDTGTSIFGRHKPLAPATLRRIAAGLERYVFAGKPYLVGGGAAFITQFNHNCIGQSVREPIKTITCGAGHFGLVTAFLMSYYGNSRDARGVDEPLPTITTKDRFGLVLPLADESTRKLADVRLRMLKPEELKRCQGFPPEYIIDRYSDGTRVTKTEQVAKIGNSVVPLMAKRIVAANVA